MIYSMILGKCENTVSEDDCVRLLVAKAYSCDAFTREQKKACQGTCNECIDDEEPIGEDPQGN